MIWIALAAGAGVAVGIIAGAYWLAWYIMRDMF